MTQWWVAADPGVDDAVALLYLMGQTPGVLSGVVPVAGNVSAAQASRNVRRVMSLVPEDRHPQVLQLTGDESRNARSADWHGQDGLGDAPWVDNAPSIQPTDNTKVIDQLPGQQWLWLAPMSLVAQRTHELSAEALIMMGGGESDHPNWNLTTDPQAAELVLRSAARVTVIPSRVTARMVIGERERRQCEQLPGAIGRWLGMALGTLERVRSCEAPGAPLALHDAVIAVLAVHPEMGLWEERSIGISREVRSRGQFHPHPSGACVTWCVGFDRHAVWTELNRVLTTLAIDCRNQRDS